VLYPEDGVTKRELADYYAAAALRLLPHLADRPLSLVRATGDRSAFFQKHYRGTPPPGLELACIDLGSGLENYVVCRDASGLASLAQLATVELHSWGSLAGDPLHADRLTLDLDPDPELPWRTVADAALVVRALLQDFGLESWCKTTGGKGLHVVVPIGRGLPDWPTAKACTRAIAAFLARELPSRFVAQTGAERRRGRIFVDYLRNAAGATAVAAYSPRQRAGVPVSVPIPWADVERDRDVRGTHFALPKYDDWSRGRRDPWEAYWRCGQKFDAARFDRLAARPTRTTAAPGRTATASDGGVSAGGRAGTGSRARGGTPRPAAKRARRSR
jgi:bifunctional non-homologous end joining protein LigD